MKTFTRLFALGLTAGVLALGPITESARAAGEAEPPPAQDWSFNGIFGHWDVASIQRGYQVYREACSACHGMRLVAFRNLQEVGFSEEEVVAVAAEYVVEDGPDEFGDMFERPAIPADRFVSPFANDTAARASNNGALPVDLSVIAKARANGPDYIYSLLLGYEDEAPADVELGPGMNYNHYYPGNQIAMPRFLYDDIIEYQNPDTPVTAEQYAWDVTNFLMWTAEPGLEDRKRMGLKVILFLIVFTGLMYAVKKKVWADVH